MEPDRRQNERRYLILAPVAIAIWLAEKIFKIKIEIKMCE